MTRERYWLPFEDAMLDKAGDSEFDRRDAKSTLNDCAYYLEHLDFLMHYYCGVEKGRTRESMYRLLGHLARTANGDTMP